MDHLIAWFLDPVHLTGNGSIPQRVFEHVALSAAAILTATVAGLPVGLYIGHTRRFASLAINIANIGRALPSYALVVMILPLSLSWDHRVIDGAAAARFNVYFASLLGDFRRIAL